MTPVPPAHEPGSMTVSFLFGWQHILTGLLLLIALAVVFFLALAAGKGERSDWQEGLAARSRRHEELTDSDDVPAEPSRS
jgi:hypothetical protein